MAKAKGKKADKLAKSGQAKSNQAGNNQAGKAANRPNPKPPKGMSQERYDKLVAESQAPFKGLRKFLYVSAGASGAIGGFVFFTKILAGRDIAESLPNLALQVGVVAIAVFLFRWEDRKKEDK